ncbi:MAG: hypothetical protein ABII00_04160 [Elusimicrobiota bacterium]
MAGLADGISGRDEPREGKEFRGLGAAVAAAGLKARLPGRDVGTTVARAADAAEITCAVAGGQEPAARQAESRSAM